jgi:phage repressor protein C with HTH and peptisase S24 domain
VASRIVRTNAPGKRKPKPRVAGADQAGFVARLQLVVQQWPSADRLAKATGVSPSAFRKWLNGLAEPRRDRLVALAEAAGVTVSWLAQGEGAEPDLHRLANRAHSSQSGDGPGTLNPAQFLVLPTRPEAAAAGSGEPPARVPTEFIGFRHDWLRNTFSREPGDLILEIAIGESMEPGIRSGDLLLIDATDQTFRNFGIYVIAVRGERLVKRVQRKFDGSLILISDNTVYQPEPIPADLAKEVQVVGRVVWRAGQI